MKTIFIWDSCGDVDLHFFVLDGDYSKFDGIYLDAVNNEDLQPELGNLIFNTDGSYKVTLLENFPMWAIEDSPDTKVIVAGYIP